MAWLERHNGGWRGRYRDADGKKRTAGSAPTKRKALQLARAEEARVQEGRWFDPSPGQQTTFSEYFERLWLPNRVMELNTRLTYETHYRATLEPTFGSMPLTAIRPSTVQRWVAEQLAADEVRPSTVVARFKSLQTILAAKRGASALRDGFIQVNPCAGVNLPYAPRREVTIYTPEEADAVIAHLPPWWRLLPLLAADLGTRWGEALGIEVGDFTPDFRSVRISRTVIEVGKEASGNGTPFAIKPYPKGKKPREISLSPDASTAVHEHVRRLGLTAGDRLFSMPDGEAPKRTDAWPHGLPPSRSFFRGVWGRAIKDAGVPHRRFHDLRASNISWLLAGGLDLPTTMKRAGHVQFETTLRYTQTLPDEEVRAQNALAHIRDRYKRKELG